MAVMKSWQFPPVASMTVALVFTLANMFTLSGCRTRPAAMSVQKDAVRSSEPAWFAGGDQVINFCVKSTPEIETRIRATGIAKTTDVTGLVLRTYAYWVAYMVHKGVQPNFRYTDAIKAVGGSVVQSKFYDVHDVPVDPRLDFDWPAKAEFAASNIKRSFPVAMTWVLDCADADLEVHFGTRPDATFLAPDEEVSSDSLLGAVFSSRVPSRHHPQWHRGAIVLKNQSEAMEYGDLVEPEFVLMHEWGHVLGVPHITGTVMDPDAIKEFAAQAKISRYFPPAVRVPMYAHSVYVDRWRQLVLCAKDLCKNYGVALGSLPSAADVSDRRGLDTLKFGYLGVLSSSATLPEVSRDFGSIQTQVDTPIAEVFRRESSYGANPVMYKSVVINRWLNRTNLTKIVLNGNTPHTSPVLVEGNCKLKGADKGKSITIFAAGFVDRLAVVMPFGWNKTEEKTPLLNMREFRDCVGDPSMVPEAKFLEVSQYQDQILSGPIARIPSEGVVLRGSPFVKEMNLPAAHTYCDQSTAGMQVCLFQHDGLALLRMGSLANSVIAFMAPVLSAKLPADGRLKLGWNGTINMQVPGFDSEHFEFRIGISQDFGTATQVKYELDIALLAGVWFNLISGTLTTL